MAAPVLQALLVADHIYQDQATGKFVICGIFGTIFFLPGNDEPSQKSDAASKDSGAGNPTAPESGASGKGASGQGPQQLPLNRLIRAGSPSAYVSLTEVNGQRSFELRYVDLNENNVIFTFEFQVECRNPLETVQMTIPLPVLPVPHEGVFALELVCEGELLGSHRILTKRQSRQS